jgi:hypothetical protein
MILYVDASAGVSGDMLLMAIRDLGLPDSKVAGALRRLGPGAPRRAGELIRWIRSSRLQTSLKKNLLRVWSVLARAEALSHRCPWPRVRFHQLSRPEVMRNTLGFCAGLSHFRIRKVYTGPVPMGKLWRDPSGRVRRESGPTASLLLVRARLPVKWTDDPFEWTTPTGAALLAAFAAPNPPPLRLLGIGHGIGRLRSPCSPKPLRLLLAEPIDR